MAKRDGPPFRTRKSSGTGGPRPPRPEPSRAAAPWSAANPTRSGQPLIYGLHSVAEALKNPRRRIRALFVTENALQRLTDMVGEPRIAPTLMRPEAVGALVGSEAVHQGVAIEAEPLPTPDLHDLPDDGLLVVLDQVTDPHNVGAILRSAAAFGAAAVVVTERHSPEATGVLAKAASGALEHVPIVAVGNLAQALTTLGKRGWWRVGLDSDGPVTLAEAAQRPPLALVLGAEGKGLRRLTRERCDTLARLDMPGAIRSLNVSNAAAVALYALTTPTRPVEPVTRP
jgi:23S rRNA (guanosine2251-2'-O)-methyltransferase